MRKKIYSLMAAMLLASVSLMAQNEKGWSYAGEVGIGSQLEIGGRAQYGLNEWIALDVPVLKYNFDYGDYNHHELKIMAGARGFSPTFGPNLKAFMGLDLGYGGMTAKHANWTSCFALDLTVGLYVYKNLYVGYGFGLLANDGSHKDHVLRVGWNF